MRRAGKRDGNHAEIRDTLRALGCVVFDAGGVGGGFPDLIVGSFGDIYLLEVKDGTLPPSKRVLTADEKTFHKLWGEYRVYVVNSKEEAARVVGIVGYG